MAQDDLIRIGVAVNDVIKIYEQIIDLILVLCKKIVRYNFILDLSRNVGLSLN